MTTIITGRIASTLYRFGASSDQLISQGRCQEIIESATANAKSVVRIRESLGFGLARTWLIRARVPLDEESLDPYDGPLQLLLPAHAASKRDANLRLHFCSWTLPGGVLRQVRPEVGLGADVFVTLPALTLRLSARGKSLVGTLLEALGLCGTYVLGEDDAFPCLYDVRPAATPSELRRELQAMDELERSLGNRGGYGLGRCMRALSLTVPSVGSPMEARVLALLCLPVRLSGFGLPLPEPNGVIALDDAERGILGSASMRVDLLWRKAGIGIEYESDEWHINGVTESRVLRDKRRLLVARMEGVELLPLTRDVVMSPWKMTTFANSLAKRLGKRVKRLSESSTEKRLACYEEIFGAI